MNKKPLRFAAILLSIVIFTAIFAACGDSVSVLQCDSIEITEGVYRYWYKQQKEFYLSSYGDLVDSHEFWQSKMPNTDKTYAEFIDERIRTQIEYYLAGNVIFEQLDLTLSKTVRDGIAEEINDGINAFGSRSKYDAYLEERYGIDSATLKDIKIMEQKFYAVYTYLYDKDNGIDKATDAEIERFYNDNFARIKYYMVLKKYDYVYDKNGNRVTDKSGKFEMEELDAAGQAENKAHAEEVAAALKDGKNIDEYMKKYYPDLYKNYPNGYYVLENQTYGALFTATIINAAFSLEIGDSKLVENEDAYFVVYRDTLPEKAYLGSDKAQFSDIASDAVEVKFTERFEKVIANFVKDQALIESFSVATL